MKIGILTFHHSRNYGAVLQAYGLIHVLEEMGHKAETIDYRNKKISERKSLFSIKEAKKNIFKYVIRCFNSWWGYNKQKQHFYRFEKKYLHLTDIVFQPQEISNTDYDCIIVGSDQVWSPIITGGPDLVYWGKYKPEKSHLLAYAASSCDTNLMETEEFANVGSWLNSFDAISVREERLKEYVERHSMHHAYVVLDPTLLAGKGVFNEIASPRLIKEPYILYYRVEPNLQSNKIVKEVARLYNARIVAVERLSIRDKISRVFDGIKYVNASVEELLSLIKYAECVVALSFHGTALSLLFEKDFFSIKGKDISRVESVLNNCDLKRRIISDSSEVFKDSINYGQVNEALNVLRDNSLNWLIKNLNLSNKDTLI